MASGYLPIGHRRRGAGISLDSLVSIERGIVLSRHKGNTWYVDSAAVAGGDGQSWGGAYTTIVLAAAAAQADDLILIAPQHVETIATANQLDFTKSGVRVVGLGYGANRSTINFSAVAGSVRVNANSVTFENLLFTGGIDNVTTCITINGKTDFSMLGCEYRDVTGQCAKFFHAVNNSDRLTIDGFRYVGDPTAGTTHAFTFDGCDDLIFRNFKIAGNFSTAAVAFITTLSARVDVHDGIVWNQNSADVAFVDTITGSTGQFGDLRLTLTDNAANITEAITGATFHIDADTVFCVNAVNEKAIVINWTASADL